MGYPAPAIEPMHREHCMRARCTVVETPCEAGGCASRHGVLRLREALASPMSRLAQDDHRHGSSRAAEAAIYFVLSSCAKHQLRACEGVAKSKGPEEGGGSGSVSRHSHDA